MTRKCFSPTRRADSRTKTDSRSKISRTMWYTTRNVDFVQRHANLIPQSPKACVGESVQTRHWNISNVISHQARKWLLLGSSISHHFLCSQVKRSRDHSFGSTGDSTHLQSWQLSHLGFCGQQDDAISMPSSYAPRLKNWQKSRDYHGTLACTLPISCRQRQIVCLSQRDNRDWFYWR